MDVFSELRTGQYVRVKGQLSDEAMIAQKVQVKSNGSAAVIKARLKKVDAEGKIILLPAFSLRLENGIQVRDTANQAVSIETLQEGTPVKVEGAYSRESGFTPDRIELRHELEFEHEQLRGRIEDIDAESRTFTVLGKRVHVDKLTDIRGF